MKEGTVTASHCSIEHTLPIFNHHIMSNNNDAPLPIDYASQNEEWILICDRLEEEMTELQVERNNNNSNDDNDNDDDDTARIHLESTLLAARMGRLSNITCALVEAENHAAAAAAVAQDCSNDAAATTTKAATRHQKQQQSVLQHYLWQTERDFDRSPHQPLVELLAKGYQRRKKKDNKKIEDSGGPAKNDAATVSVQSYSSPSSSSSAMNASAQEDLCVELQVEAFFQEYPQFLRSDYGTMVGDSDEDSSCASTSSQAHSQSKKPPVAKTPRLVEETAPPRSACDPSTSTTASSSNRSSKQAPNAPATNGKKPINEVIDLMHDDGDDHTASTTNQRAEVGKQQSSMPPPPPPPPSIDLHGNNGASSSRPPSRSGLENNRPNNNNTFSYTPASQDTVSSTNRNGGGQATTTTHRQQPDQHMAPPPPPAPSTTNWGQTQPPVTRNPYAPASRQQQHPQQAPMYYPPSSNAATHAVSAVQNNQAAWDNHRHQQQNPFQTAREMADAGQLSVRNNHNRPEQPPAPQPSRSTAATRQWGQPPQQQQHPSDYGYSYHQENNNGYLEDDGGGSVVPSGPNIPESLKRKFQPPKRVDNNNGKGGGSRAFAPAKGGGVQARSSQTNRSSSSSANGSQKNNNSNNGAQVASHKSNSNDSDDEELPEELQHLDKELVKKIENEIMESGETVNFDDIAGLKDAKQTVLEVVVWPMQRPDVFTGLRRAPNGLLLFGPPGTGKTLIGKAIANETNATFFSISSSSLTSKWIGEGEKLVKTLFAVAAYREPAVVFIDEIDSLLTQRKSTENEASRRIKTEFLVQLDGAGTSKQGRVLTIGATNRPQELDEAARRRFTKRMYIPLPVEGDRRILLQVMLKNNNHKLTEAQIETLAKETDGFSGADIKSLCTDAAMGPIRQLGAKAMQVEVKDIPAISFKHFKKSLKGTRPSVSPEDIVQYIEWDRIYGSSRAEEEDCDDDDDDDDD